MLATWIFTVVLAADAVTVQTKPRVYLGNGSPTVTVIVRQPIDGATLRLKREDMKVFQFEVPKSRKGQYTFKLEQPAGTALEYDGELEVRFHKVDVGVIPLSFRGEVVVPIEVHTKATLAQIAARQFDVSASRDIVKVDMALTGEAGTSLGQFVYKPPRPSSRFVAEWPRTASPVLTIDATFTDQAGVGRTMQLTPWCVEVAHDDVSFATGQFDIPPAEEPKMAVAYARVVAAAEKASKHAAVKLFVIGHTDTVGTGDNNLTLSQKRAKALALYFRKHGFALPVVFAGLGESSLLEATADEIDNARNRRAQYVLAVDPPELGVPIAWQKLL